MRAMCDQAIKVGWGETLYACQRGPKFHEEHSTTIQVGVVKVVVKW